MRWRDSDKCEESKAYKCCKRERCIQRKPSPMHRPNRAKWTDPIPAKPNLTLFQRGREQGYVDKSRNCGLRFCIAARVRGKCSKVTLTIPFGVALRQLDPHFIESMSSIVQKSNGAKRMLLAFC